MNKSKLDSNELSGGHAGPGYLPKNVIRNPALQIDPAGAAWSSALVATWKTLPMQVPRMRRQGSAYMTEIVS
jgi:hypothetical protein